MTIPNIPQEAVSNEEEALCLTAEGTGLFWWDVRNEKPKMQTR
jgi:hypothetical protein